MPCTAVAVALLLGVLACRTHPRGGTTESVDDLALPPSVVEFRDALRTAETMRVWLVDPKAHRDRHGSHHNRVHRTILSVHARGILAIDSNSHREIRWSKGEFPPDAPSTRQNGRLVRQMGTAFSAEADTRAAVVQTFIATVRSADTRWRPMEHAKPKVLPALIELRAWTGYPDGWRLYIRFGLHGQPSTFIAKLDDWDTQKDRWFEHWLDDGSPYFDDKPGDFEIDMIRVELDPALSPRWFGPNFPAVAEEMRVFEDWERERRSTIVDTY